MPKRQRRCLRVLLWSFSGTRTSLCKRLARAQMDLEMEISTRSVSVFPTGSLSLGRLPVQISGHFQAVDYRYSKLPKNVRVKLPRSAIWPRSRRLPRLLQLQRLAWYAGSDRSGAGLDTIRDGPSTSGFGTERTLACGLTMSAIGGGPDIPHRRAEVS